MYILYIFIFFIQFVQNWGLFSTHMQPILPSILISSLFFLIFFLTDYLRVMKKNIWQVNSTLMLRRFNSYLCLSKGKAMMVRRGSCMLLNKKPHTWATKNYAKYCQRPQCLVSRSRHQGWMVHRVTLLFVKHVMCVSIVWVSGLVVNLFAFRHFISSWATQEETQGSVHNGKLEHYHLFRSKDTGRALR